MAKRTKKNTSEKETPKAKEKVTETADKEVVVDDGKNVSSDNAAVDERLQKAQAIAEEFEQKASDAEQRLAAFEERMAAREKEFADLERREREAKQRVIALEQQAQAKAELTATADFVKGDTDEPLVRPATQQEVADLAMTTSSVGVARQQHSDHVNEARRERQKLGRRKVARGGQMGPQTHTVINKVNNTNHTMMATLPPGSDYDLYEIEFRAGKARVPPIVADKLRKIRNLDVK